MKDISWYAVMSIVRRMAKSFILTVLYIGFAVVICSAQKYPVPSYLGIHSHITRTVSHDNEFTIRNEIMTMVTSKNMNLIRTGFRWREIEPEKGKYHWDQFDDAVESAKERGIRLLGLVHAPPKWALPMASHIDDWASFLDAVVKRYGDFIEHWEIWNEPNGKRFWPQEEGAVVFAQYVIRSYPIIKGQYPDATVILGGLADNKIAFSFWKTLFQEGVLDYCDAVALHPYTFPAQKLIEYTDELKDLMKKYGVTDKSFWITEFGGSSKSDKYNVKGTPEYQSTVILKTALTFWVLGGEHFIIFEFMDQKKSPAWSKFKYYGIVDSNMKPKAALSGTGWLSRILNNYDYVSHKILQDGVIVEVKHKSTGESAYLSWGTTAAKMLKRSAQKRGIRSVENYINRFEILQFQQAKKVFKKDSIFLWKGE